MKHKNVFSFCNQKGGVGKTTSAINLATALALKGRGVLLIDMDPQGNATSGLGEEKKRSSPTIYPVMVDDIPLSDALITTKVAGLSLVPSNSELSGAEIELISLPEREYRLRKALYTIRDRFDYIFIDCPPSLGLITVNSITASDYIIIPLQCEYYALEGLGELLETYSRAKRGLNPELELGGVLLTMADFRTRLTEQVIKEVREYFHEKVFEAVIPRSVKLSEAPSFGKPGVIYDVSSRGSKSYIDVAEEFMKRFEAKTGPEEAMVDSEERSQETVTKEGAGS